MNFRIGHGYDVHRLVPNRPLIIGGVSIPHSMGLDGHSDADVLAHAIADALLGSVALGDLGKHFPDTDPTFKNANSLVLLRTCYMQVVELGYIIGNLDATIIAQTPKMAPYLLQMRQNLAHVLECSVEQINVKATTEEHLGFTGEKLGISAHCVCLLEKNHLGI